MKSLAIAAAAILAIVGLSSGSAKAGGGCVRGAVIGGVVGHVAGHHGLLGAGAGCLIGRHETNRRASRNGDRDRSYGAHGSSYDPGYRYREGSGYSR